MKHEDLKRAEESANPDNALVASLTERLARMGGNATDSMDAAACLSGAIALKLVRGHEATWNAFLEAFARATNAFAKAVENEEEKKRRAP